MLAHGDGSRVLLVLRQSFPLFDTPVRPHETVWYASYTVIALVNAELAEGSGKTAEYK